MTLKSAYYQKSLWILAGILWLGGISAGLGSLWQYEHTFYPIAASQVSWPSTSQLHHSFQRPTLIMFVHPNCPCTRASLNELTTLMAHNTTQVDAYIYFYRPLGTSSDWDKTDLWEAAKAIPGVKVLEDPNNIEAKNFHITTSGHTLLYSSQGKLLFSGGITLSRGHIGNNFGEEAISALLNNGQAKYSRTPVFGCSLVTPNSSSGKGEICHY